MAPESSTLSSKGRQTRLAIEQAPRKLHAERGFHRTMLADITSAAGKSPAVFYRHFDDKEDLPATGPHILTADNDAAALGNPYLVCEAIGRETIVRRSTGHSKTPEAAGSSRSARRRWRPTTAPIRTVSG